MHIIIPTLNAAKDWDNLARALLACVAAGQVLIIDSHSTDGTVDLALATGFRVHSIARTEFNHGCTRMAAAEILSNNKVLVYMTQDAVLADSTSISRLIAVLDDQTVDAAYGRQLPRPHAEAIESLARHFNYPETSHIRDLKSREEVGINLSFYPTPLPSIADQL